MELLEGSYGLFVADVTSPVSEVTRLLQFGRARLVSPKNSIFGALSPAEMAIEEKHFLGEQAGP
jgi:hypothetical protein